MSNIDISALFSKIKECKNAIIVGHSHPDGDCVGSAAGLAVLLEKLGKTAKIIFPELPPNRLGFILEGRELISELPENLDDYDIICIDLASPVQMASLREAIESRVFIRIDHHDLDRPYAKYEFVNPLAAAAGEIVFDLFEYAKKAEGMEFPSEALTPVFAAISSDTGCFKYANVTENTHVAAAKLISLGAPTAEINRLLFDTKDIAQLKAEGIAISKIETFCDGKISGIAVDLCDYEGGLNIKDFETAIDFARSVRGAKCAVCVKASPTVGAFRASLRANGDTDVSKVAAIFGGGGHLRAAGCTVHAESAKEALGMIVKELEKVM